MGDNERHIRQVNERVNLFQQMGLYHLKLELSLVNLLN